MATSRSWSAVHREQFYVSVSRGRERCRVFTDDKELMRARVGCSSARAAAIEVVPATPSREAAQYPGGATPRHSPDGFAFRRSWREPEAVVALPADRHGVGGRGRFARQMFVRLWELFFP